MSTSQVKINSRHKAAIHELDADKTQWALVFHDTLELIFCVKRSRSRQQHGAYIKYSWDKSHQISMWTSPFYFWMELWFLWHK